MDFFKKIHIKEILSKKNLLILSTIFLSLTISFVSGTLAAKTKIEDVSNYISNVVRDDIKENLLPITVETFDGTSLPDSEYEFRRLYGVFRQERITFASGYNLTKEEEIIVSEIDKTENLSAVYIGSTTGSDEYEDHYRDVTYPVEFFFPLVRYDSVSMKTVCIGESQAKKVLANRGVKKDNYTKADFETLLGTPFYIDINKVETKFVIQDIFFDDTYYVSDLRRTIGDFFITSYYFPKEVRKQNTYFMSQYQYENKYFIDYINELYSGRNCLLKCVTNQGKNLRNPIDEQKIISFFGMKSRANFFETTMITVAITLLVITFFLLYLFIERYELYLFISHVVVVFIPFIIFFIINIFAKNVFLFSEVGTKTNAILSIIFVLGFTAFYIFKKYRPKSKKELSEDHEEMDI